MELAEIVLSILFSGLLIVIMIAVYFVCKNKLHHMKIIKRAVADLKFEQSGLKEPLPEHMKRSIEEKTSGRYKPFKLYNETYLEKDNTKPTHLEHMAASNYQDVLSTMQIKRTSKKFSRLERII